MEPNIIKVSSAKYRLLEDGYGEKPGEEALRLFVHLWRFYRSGIKQFAIPNLCNALDLESPSQLSNLFRELTQSKCIELI